MGKFNFEECVDLSKVCLVDHEEYHDHRGCFSEIFRESDFSEGLEKFLQLNYSRSHKGVFRGLHYQSEPYQTSKLIKCLNGGICDIALDMNPESETFGQYTKTILRDTDRSLLYVPQTHAHGFLALEDNTIITYFTSQYHRDELGVCVSYRGLDIDFPIEVTNVSEKDRTAITFEEYCEKIGNEE